MHKGVGVSGSSVKLFCFKVPKVFVKEPFCVSEKFPDGKNVKEKRLWASQLCFEIVCFSVAKHFVEEPFLVSKTFWYRKMSRIRKRRVSRLCVEMVSSHSTESFSRGTLLYFKNFFWKSVREKKVGGHHDCPQIFLSYLIETFRMEPFIVSEKF